MNVIKEAESARKIDQIVKCKQCGGNGAHGEDLCLKCAVDNLERFAANYYSREYYPELEEANNRIKLLELTMPFPEFIERIASLIPEDEDDSWKKQLVQLSENIKSLKIKGHSR